MVFIILIFIGFCPDRYFHEGRVHVSLILTVAIAVGTPHSMWYCVQALFVGELLKTDSLIMLLVGGKIIQDLRTWAFELALLSLNYCWVIHWFYNLGRVLNLSNSQSLHL